MILCGKTAAGTQEAGPNGCGHRIIISGRDNERMCRGKHDRLTVPDGGASVAGRHRIELPKDIAGGLAERDDAARKAGTKLGFVRPAPSSFDDTPI